jgi:hypothetical protein
MEEMVECHECGTANAPEATNCRICGASLGHEHMVREGSTVCPTCGAELEKEQRLCNSCKTPVRDIIMSNLPGDLPAEECVHWSESPASATRASMLYVAAILVLIGGVLGITQAILGLTPDLGDDFLRIFGDLIPGVEAADDLMAEYVLLQIGVFLFGSLAIFGSLFIFSRSDFRLSLVGGVSGVLAVGFLIGSFLSIVGLMLLIVSRKQFLSECG